MSFKERTAKLLAEEYKSLDDLREYANRLDNLLSYGKKKEESEKLMNLLKLRLRNTDKEVIRLEKIAEKLRKSKSIRSPQEVIVKKKESKFEYILTDLKKMFPKLSHGDFEFIQMLILDDAWHNEENAKPVVPEDSVDVYNMLTNYHENYEYSRIIHEDILKSNDDIASEVQRLYVFLNIEKEGKDLLDRVIDLMEKQALSPGRKREPREKYEDN